MCCQLFSYKPVRSVQVIRRVPYDLELHMDSFFKLAVVPLGITLAVVVYRASRPSKGNAGGFGPPGRFLLGNALDMPTQYEWLSFDKWKEVYGRLCPHSNSVLFPIWANFPPEGPILSLNVLGQSITILGTVESASLLLDKHSAINSDRPELQMAGKL